MRKYLLVLISLSVGLASTQRIMTYNVMNYNGGDAGQKSALRIVIEAANPDIIIAEEIKDQAGYNSFLSDVLNYSTPGLYAGATFTDQNETNIDIALYYKPERFSFVSTSRINTTNLWGRRDVIEFVMLHDASGVEFRVYGCHLKAGTGADDENERTAESAKLRNYLNELNPDTPFIVAGDFNLYNSSEGAFQRLTESQDDNDGQCFDPVNRIGYWHENLAYAGVHTQSTRGSFGGMDDRFDWLFVSQSILNDNDLNYIDGTYIPFGNDGNHFNKSINDGTNSAVTMTVANALAGGSDHVPVFMDLEFNDIVESAAKIIITEIMPNPSRVSDSFGEWMELFNHDTTQYNLQGWTIKDADTDLHVIADDLFIGPGEYLVIGRNADESLNGGVPVDYVAAFALSNKDDELIIMDNLGNRVDEVAYTSAFPFGNGVSMYVRDLAVDNALVTNWAASTIPYGAGDLGTPGRAADDTLSVGHSVELPVRFILQNPYPNPFNPVIHIPLQVNTSARLEIQIFDMKGQLVQVLAVKRYDKGNYTFSWDAGDYATGLYFVRAVTEDYSQKRKILLIK